MTTFESIPLGVPKKLFFKGVGLVYVVLPLHFEMV